MFSQYTGGVFTGTEAVNHDSGIQYDDSGDKTVFELCAGVPCTFSIDQMKSDHYGMCDDYVVRGCSHVW